MPLLFGQRRRTRQKEPLPRDQRHSENQDRTRQRGQSRHDAMAAALDRAPRIAWANSAADANRSVGAAARARRQTASIPVGIDGSSVDGGGTPLHFPRVGRRSVKSS